MEIPTLTAGFLSQIEGMTGILITTIGILGGAIAIMFRMMHVQSTNHTNQLLSMQARSEVEKSQIAEKYSEQILAERQERKELIDRFDQANRKLIDDYNSMTTQMVKVTEKDVAAKRELVQAVNYLTDEVRRKIQ